jgi:hypothetical protein
MCEIEQALPIKRGTWLYAGSIPREVRIVKHHTLYGTGDYEDSPEIAEDQNVECFYILYRTSVDEPQWVGGGAALTLLEAVTQAEATLGSGLRWNDV